MVETEFLASNLELVKVIDASWYMPAAKREPKKDFLERRIPRSVHFDIDEVADRTTTLPHMFPTPEVFAEAVGIVLPQC